MRKTISVSELLVTVYHCSTVNTISPIINILPRMAYIRDSFRELHVLALVTSFLRTNAHLRSRKFLTRTRMSSRASRVLISDAEWLARRFHDLQVAGWNLGTATVSKRNNIALVIHSHLLRPTKPFILLVSLIRTNFVWRLRSPCHVCRALGCSSKRM